MDSEQQTMTMSTDDTLGQSSPTAVSASDSLAHISSLAAAAAQATAQQSNLVMSRPMIPEGSPAVTTGGMDSGMPTCQNCGTSRTPLWRRDEFGSVLCNACGLFLKLHGRARPLSLKTDVIKSRNRVKAMRPDLIAKKKQQAAQGFSLVGDVNGAEATAVEALRRSSQKAVNGTDSLESSLLRTGASSMYNNSLGSFVVDDPYQTGSVTGFNGTGNGDGTVGSSNGDRGNDMPQTQDQLLAQNASLKTRVSELEVIYELFRGRLSQLEEQEATARREQEIASIEQTELRTQLEASQESERQLRSQLEDSHRRENNLKRRLDEIEVEAPKHTSSEEDDDVERPAKKARIGDDDEAAVATDDDLATVGDVTE